MTIMKKDLQALNRGIKAIEKKMEKLITAVEKSEKPKVANKTTAKPAKAKTTKRSPAQKASAKKENRTTDGNRSSPEYYQKIEKRG